LDRDKTNVGPRAPGSEGTVKFIRGLMNLRTRIRGVPRLHACKQKKVCHTVGTSHDDEIRLRLKRGLISQAKSLEYPWSVEVNNHIKCSDTKDIALGGSLCDTISVGAIGGKTKRFKIWPHAEKGKPTNHQERMQLWGELSHRVED